MTETIAVFDFDGTITKRDSFLSFLVYAFGPRAYLKLFFLLPGYLLFKLGLVSAAKAKEKIWASFFRGFEEKKLNEIGRRFAETLPNLLKPAALEKIAWHRVRGHQLVIVSASLSSWIEPWAKWNGFGRVIATEPEITAGRVTGRLKTKNCAGEEKVARFFAAYPDRSAYTLYAYGDGASDRQLLSHADYPFYRSF